MNPIKQYTEWQEYRSDKPPTMWIVLGYVILLSGCLVSYSSCSTIKKIVHKERHKSDSTIVKHIDSVGVLRESYNSNDLHIENPEIVIEYDTLFAPPEGAVINAPTTEVGKMLSEAIAASTQAGRPNRITIRAHKLENLEEAVKRDQSASVKTDETVRVVKENATVLKEIKRRSWWWLLWFLLIIPAVVIYKNRQSVWVKVLKLFTPIIK
jgi:hypothetical protein